MNIISIKVECKQQLADVYLEVDPVTREMSGKDILETLSGLDGLQSIRFIKTMPNINRQNTFHTVLDNVSDGIISIDAKWRITAINRNLERLMETGAFRKDLYYRINVLPIHLLSLNARTEEIPILEDLFLFQINCKLGTSLQHLSPEALDKLVHHSWPGNVRELKNVIEQSSKLRDNTVIGLCQRQVSLKTPHLFFQISVLAFIPVSTSGRSNF